MKITPANFVLGALCLSGVTAFAPIHHHQRLAVVDRGSTALNLNIPRLDLPDAVTGVMANLDLKNPNSLGDSEYRSYAGAAIAGTLLFFLLPGALVSGIFGNLAPVAIAILIDFTFSALIGGGLLIYLSCRSDSIGQTVRQYGGQFLGAVKDATGISTFRYDLPSAATDVMTGELGLMNPNTMNEDDYDGYSGAAVVGTLFFFLLPGAIITGATDTLVQFAVSGVVDFGLSALVGGGAAIFLSLGGAGGEVGSTVNQGGSKLLDFVEGLLEGNPKLPF